VKKGIIILAMLAMFISLPLVDSQTGLNSINTSINLTETYEIYVSSSLEGDTLYMNLTISDENVVNVNVYRGVSHLPIDEIYNGGGTGTFEANITLVGGAFTIYLYNPVDNGAVIFIHGGWAVNYEPPETITDETTTTETWTGTTKPVDILEIFWNIFFSWVIPALATLLVLYIIWRRCFRVEHHDYLATFESKELLYGGEPDEDRIL